MISSQPTPHRLPGQRHSCPADAARHAARAAAWDIGQARSKIAQDARRNRRAGGRVLRPARPDAGLAAAYRKKIDCLVEEMDASVRYWLRAAYRQNEPVLAADEAPALALAATVRRLARRWQRRFRDASVELAAWFGQRARSRSRRSLQKILSDGGWTVEMTTTPAERDVLHATIQQNVALIRSIPQRYFGEIEGAVMRSVQSGHDLAQLTRSLEKNYRVTRRRAALIARDQNNKASAALNRARQLDLGLDQGIWVHSHAGKKPRPTHLKNDGKTYSVRDGWFDPDPRVRRRIHPGELIGCRCFGRPIVPGFS